MSAKKALGRGLKALIPDTPKARAGLAELPVEQIRANPSQPRHRFDQSALEQLAASITEHGLLQPLLVSEYPDGGYVLIAGERRWRAARLAGMAMVPAVIRERLTADRELELALVENLQRRDLTPLEEAAAFEQLRTAAGLSQAAIAERVGIDRSTVANALRLLKLPAEVRELVETGDLSAGHGRSLLAFPDSDECRAWAQRAIEHGLSVRDLERAAAQVRKTQSKRSGSAAPRSRRDPNLVEAEDRLARRLGAKVEISTRRRGGKIVISCDDKNDLMRVFDLLMEGS